MPTSWSRDGRFLLYQSPMTPQSPPDVWVVPLEGNRTPVPLLKTEFAESEARFSPDGRWISFTSDVSRRNSVYVRSFDPLSPESPGTISPPVGTGTSARWRQDGKELFFDAPDGTIMAVDVSTAGQFRQGTPRPLFRVPPGSFWDVMPDGKKFLVAWQTEEQVRAPLTVVLNWGAAPVK
jgi:Tol biopolymer transport system component